MDDQRLLNQSYLLVKVSPLHQWCTRSSPWHLFYFQETWSLVRIHAKDHSRVAVRYRPGDCLNCIRDVTDRCIRYLSQRTAEWERYMWPMPPHKGWRYPRNHRQEKFLYRLSRSSKPWEWYQLLQGRSGIGFRLIRHIYQCVGWTDWKNIRQRWDYRNNNVGVFRAHLNKKFCRRKSPCARISIPSNPAFLARVTEFRYWSMISCAFTISVIFVLWP